MIIITETPEGITVEGHARYAPMGEDIVCSAISTLVQTLIASVDALTVADISSDVRHGNAVIKYEVLTATARTLIEAFFIGARGVADAYPHCVKVSRPSVDCR